MRTALQILTICSIAFLPGCYTVLDHSESGNKSIGSQASPRYDPEKNYSIVVGTVDYHGTANTRETHYHAGFILTERNWLLNPPPREPEVAYLSGPIDSSFLRRTVTIYGMYHLPAPKVHDPNAAPDYTSEMQIRIDSLQVIR